jgi:hypothetical protein
MISHHKSTTYYLKGNGQVELTDKTLGKRLAKLVNANKMDWDVMVVIALWAYQTIYKVTTQYTPFELVYGMQPIMPTKFAIPTKRIHDVSQGEIDKAIQVRMEDLFRLNEIY